jgi:hypothetical protein
MRTLHFSLVVSSVWVWVLRVRPYKEEILGPISWLPPIATSWFSGGRCYFIRVVSSELCHRSTTALLNMCATSTEVYNSVLTVNTRMPTPILCSSRLGEYRKLSTPRVAAPLYLLSQTPKRRHQQYPIIPIHGSPLSFVLRAQTLIPHPQAFRRPSRKQMPVPSSP